MFDDEENNEGFTIESFHHKKKEGYISKIIELLNHNIIDNTSARAVSLLMGMNRNYLSDKQRREGKYEQYNKFFTLATNFLLLDRNEINFWSDKHYKKFIEGCLKSFFKEW